MSESSNSVQSMIQNIVTVVFRIHFYYVTDKDLEQDLKQEGYLKAYELLACGNYDPSKNLRTFIYTGVRNAMTNYMYHSRRANCDALDLVTDPMWLRYENITMDRYYLGKLFIEDDSDIEVEISNDIIDRVCRKYSIFGDYRGLAFNRLVKLGVIDRENTYNVLSNYDDFILTSIIGEILWGMFKE